MDIDALRGQTPGCAGRIHLNNAGAALLAQPTLDAMTAQLRREAEIGGYEAAAEAAGAIAATYAGLAAPSTAAMCWPTGRPPAAPAPRSSWSPATSMGSWTWPRWSGWPGSGRR